MNIHTRAESCFKEAKRHTRRKLLPLKSLEKKLDKVFSEYIRRRDADENENAYCVTCGRVSHWRELQCGHWVKRQHRSTRWEVTNAAAQCAGCNLYKSGAMDEFAGYLLGRYGSETVEELLRKKKEVTKHTRQDLEEMIALYQSKLAELER